MIKIKYISTYNFINFGTYLRLFQDLALHVMSNIFVGNFRQFFEYHSQ